MKAEKIEIFKKLGSSLIEKGQWFLKEAFHLKIRRIVSSTQIRSLLIVLGFDPNKIYFADRRYAIIDWSVMKSIIKYSWVDRKKYVAEFHDCDDYALEFKAHLSEVYNINSVALARKVQVTTNIGEILPHRHDIIIAEENNVLKAFLLETQNDGFVEIRKGVPLVIGDWQYKLNEVDF